MPSFRPGLALVSGAVILCPTSRVALAADKTPDAAQAEVLFEEGRRLMGAGDYAAACPKLAESEAREPAAGTALNLAVCYEKSGKLASAWATFKTAESLAATAGQKERAAAAKNKADKLQAAASRLTVSVPPSSQVAGLEVRRDGDILHSPEWGVSAPRDGGGHDVQASAPGKKPWTRHVELQPSGQALVVEVPPLEDAPVQTAAIGPEPQPTPAAFSQGPGLAEPGPGPSTRSARTHVLDWSLIGGGAAVGVAGAVVMAVEASRALAEDRNKPAYDSASHAWTGGLVTTLVGATVLAAGGIMFLAVNPKPDGRGARPSVWVGAGPSELRVGGAW